MFEVYRDKSGEWRWRLKAKNGEIVAVSSEGYTTSYGCTSSIKTVCRLAIPGFFGMNIRKLD